MRSLFRIVILFAIVLQIAELACSEKRKDKYPRQVGDIAFDSNTDDKKFKVCNENNIIQYYSLNGIQYAGEKVKIVEHFKEKFQGENFKSESGYVTIRFIVNCEGKSDRFRVQEFDWDYQAKKFSKDLIKQLLELTKQLDGWMVPEYKNKKRDYYQYLTFKIVDGQINEILP